MNQTESSLRTSGAGPGKMGSPICSPAATRYSSGPSLCPGIDVKMRDKPSRSASVPGSSRSNGSSMKVYTCRSVLDIVGLEFTTISTAF